MSQDGVSYPPKPAINAPLYTMVTLPDVLLSANQFVQVSDISGAGVGLMYSDGLIWRSVPFSAQRIRVQTAADGTYTWTYPTAFAVGAVPKISVVAEAPNGSTDIFNAQTDGPPTNTQCKVRVTRSPLTTVALIGLTIAVPVASASIGATWVSIIAFQ